MRSNWNRIAVATALAVVLGPTVATAFNVAEPIWLPTQTYTTTLLKSVATINRGVMHSGGKPKVFGGYVYGVYFRQGDERTMVYKLKLSDGSWSTSPLCSDTNAFGAFADPTDNHRCFDIIVDNYSYVRVTGGVHSGSASQWRSTNPTNITSFVYCPGAGEDIPDATGVTFASFKSSPSHKVFWQSDQGTPGLYSLTGFTKTWVSLGALDPSHNPQVCFDYTPYLQYDDTNLVGGIKQTCPDYAWDANGRMHFVIGLLNKNTDGPHPPFVATDIVYAYSDDGGATVYRSDGSAIDFPINATDGSSKEGEIILREDSDPDHNWLSQISWITIDKGGQPVIKCQSFTTGNHLYRREAGVWIEYSGRNQLKEYSTDPGGVICGQTTGTTNTFMRFYNPTGNNVATLTMPNDVHRYDREYYRDDGKLVWVSLSGSATSGTLKIYKTVFN